MRKDYEYQSYGRVPVLLGRKFKFGRRLTSEQRRTVLDNLDPRQIAELAFKVAAYTGASAMLYASVAMARAAGF